ncbi:M42 family metallopeptidase [Thermotoga sp. KOL6]|uniref:M42 family metallopeptidase n=1 Tax=Thermotoga sp. KOL6 TaxID=126741 RepID=UPI000C757C18|nr:M42 family metallopeptidase [Thermotoga sp. KOL6]PLV59800.1 peptidase M42 [Thermotoga sp. KOL6]
MYLKDLSTLSGVSGDEGKVRDFIKSKVENFADEIIVDKLGNLLALKKGKDSSKKFLISAHMDEVGFIVSKIEKDGRVAFLPVGGVDPRILPGKVVQVKDLKGVVGYKPIHLQRNDLESSPKFEDLRIDFGFSSSEEAKKYISIGDYVSFVSEYVEGKERVVGKAFDDRAGCSLLIDILEKDIVPAYDTYFAFTVQEETGLRGSAVVVEEIEPTCALVVETTTAGDNPELEDRRWATHLGDGPAITFYHRGYVVPRKIFQTIVDTAKTLRIPFQMKRRTAGGTDAARYAKTAYGVPAGVVSIPSRYIHSPNSVLDLKDYENTLKLVITLIEEGKIVEVS